jgi:hypothetical protein
VTAARRGKVIGVAALAKPLGVWCRHCVPRDGCAIYESCPDECRAFDCGYLQEPSLGPEWKPSESKIALVTFHGGKRIVAMSIRSAPAVVAIGAKMIAILPDRDMELNGEQ